MHFCQADLSNSSQQAVVCGHYITVKGRRSARRKATAIQPLLYIWWTVVSSLFCRVFTTPMNTPLHVVNSVSLRRHQDRLSGGSLGNFEKKKIKLNWNVQINLLLHHGYDPTDCLIWATHFFYIIIRHRSQCKRKISLLPAVFLFFILSPILSYTNWLSGLGYATKELVHDTAHCLTKLEIETVYRCSERPRWKAERKSRLL